MKAAKRAPASVLDPATNWKCKGGCGKGGFTAGGPSSWCSDCFRGLEMRHFARAKRAEKRQAARGR